MTVFWNKNTWSRSKKAFVFTEIHVKIVKQLLKCYFKHIFIIFVASKRQKCFVWNQLSYNWFSRPVDALLLLFFSYGAPVYGMFLGNFFLSMPKCRFILSPISFLSVYGRPPLQISLIIVVSKLPPNVLFNSFRVSLTLSLFSWMP